MPARLTSAALAALVLGVLVWLGATVYYVPRSDGCLDGERCMPVAGALATAGAVLAGLAFTALLLLIATPSRRRR